MGPYRTLEDHMGQKRTAGDYNGPHMTILSLRVPSYKMLLFPNFLGFSCDM